MSAETPNPHVRRYMRHMALAMIGYTLVLFGSIWLIRGFGIEDPLWRAVIATTPVLPALYALHAFLSFFRVMDEYQRRLIADSLLIATGAVGFASFAYGFAQGAADLPDISLIWVLPAIVGTYGIAAIFVRRRYQ